MLRSIIQIALTAVLLLATSLESAGAQTLPQAEALLRRGQYAEAERVLLKLARTGQPAALLAQGRLLLETGRYALAQQAARKAAKGKTRIPALTLVAEVLREQGQAHEAIKILKPLLKQKGNTYRARAYLGLLYRETGQLGLAKEQFDRFYDEYGNGQIDKTSAEQLIYVALACRYTDNFRDASDTFRDATKADPTFIEAFVQWAEISLEKYEAGYAERHYQSALKINPNHVGALIGLALVKLEQSNDVQGAELLLKQALAINPHSIDARVVQAKILVDNEQNGEAEALLHQALKHNPRHLEALTVLAASHYLRDDLATYTKLKARVLRINPKHTQFFRSIVALGVRHHRYQEVIKLSEEALRIDADDWYSLADIGLNYLRLGEDQKGLTYLRKAWQGDQYNVRNYNVLNLYDDVISKEYTFVDSKHFRLRVHRTDKALLARILIPEAERAYTHYVKKYGFVPKGPIVIELFRDSTHFGVRTVGLPGLSVLGVCFGRVITTTTPVGGRFNWGQVLWHELNHIFTIQLARSRVPRWLTEGLADMEPALVRKEWAREHDFEIYQAIRAGRLHGLSSMNSAFTRARSIHDMVVAYYQGSLMAAYLVKGWGIKAMVAALHAYGRGQRTETILPKLTGLPLSALDLKFRESERQRLVHYQHNWSIDRREFEDLKAIALAAQARPGDSELMARHAVALLLHGGAGAAKVQADAALAKDPKNRLALFVLARVNLPRNPDRAKQFLDRLLATGVDGYDLRMDLGRIALASKKLGEVEQHLRRAKQLDPERWEPYHVLAGAYRQAKRDDDAIRELKGFVAIQQQAFPPAAQLVELLAQKKDFIGVRHYGQMAYYIQPARPSLHLRLAEAYAASAPLPDLERARWHVDTGLMLKPKNTAPLQVQLGKIYLAQNKAAQAKTAFRAALKADPSDAEAKRLLKGTP
jgi:tetratricopeptide (TPR) repeat protein